MLKYGLILLVLLFGVVMAVVGYAATGAFKAAPALMASAVVSTPHKPGPVASRPATASTAAPAGVDASAVLLPAVLPDQASYAVQLGRFSDVTTARSAAIAMAPLHLPWLVVPVVAADGSAATLLAVGPYTSVDAANAVQPQLATVLHQAQALPVIMLPPPAK